MRRFASLIPLALALAAMIFVGLACAGCGASHENDVTVEQYRYVDGSLPPDSNLGITFIRQDDGTHCMVNRILEVDADPDRIVRVIVHELMNALLIQESYFAPWPDEMLPSWYLYEGDSQPPFHPIGADEAAWIAGHDAMTVHIEGAWLVEPVHEAVERINEAAGVVVFVE